MRDTACENCPFKSMGFAQCPNYIETIWNEQGNSQPRIVKDCAPKRTLLMLEELYNRTFGLQQQINQQENQVAEFRAAITQLFNAIKIIEDAKKLEIEGRKRVISQLQSMKGNHDNPICATTDCAVQDGD